MCFFSVFQDLLMEANGQLMMGQFGALDSHGEVGGSFPMTGGFPDNQGWVTPRKIKGWFT